MLFPLWSYRAAPGVVCYLALHLGECSSCCGRIMLHRVWSFILFFVYNDENKLHLDKMMLISTIYSTFTLSWSFLFR